MTKSRWTKKWKQWVAPTKLPGVWKMKEGGHIVRARVTDPTSGRMREIKRVLSDADERAAYEWLESEKAKVLETSALGQHRKQRFCDFAVSLLERKVAKREIKSAAGRERWKCTLEHLIAGTTAPDAETYVPAFGEFFLDQLRVAHVERWKEGICGLIAAGHYCPSTANGWFSILRVILKAARRELDLPSVGTDGVSTFDLSGHHTYSEELPNALTPEQTKEFLGLMRSWFPQHFAMAKLGFATGLRPSTLRALRRKGVEADVHWDSGRLLVRRSHSRGTEVMNTTKQKVRYSIQLPQEIVHDLKWHVETQLATPEQQESDILFPSLTGSFRARSVLDKPYQEISDALSFGFSITPRGMRRTFNDLARMAEVEGIANAHPQNPIPATSLVGAVGFEPTTSTV